MPGSGEIKIAPVSVCHHVSTTGHRSPPITVQYQTHASGLIGSPTEPRSRSEERSCLPGYSVPQRMNERIAVGAVYRIDTRCFSMIDHHRSLSGQSGAPSYITPVVWFASGPYTMYECPVTQPQSAAHQKTSSSWMSKIMRWVAATWVR